MNHAGIALQLVLSPADQKGSDHQVHRMRGKVEGRVVEAEGGINIEERDRTEIPRGAAITKT